MKTLLIVESPAKSKTIALLRRWKQIDIETTEAVNEAKDNLKYLSTLQRFIEPLYSGTAQCIIDTLPALINSIKVSRHSVDLLLLNATPAITTAHFILSFSSSPPFHYLQMIYTISRYYNTEERVTTMAGKEAMAAMEAVARSQ
jgi:dynein heavy chain